MDCPGCGHANRVTAKFCAQCATPLPRTCASCGAGLGSDARFCDQCGAPVAGTPETAGAAARKVVTVLFADLVGSTSFGEQVDAESAREAMAEYHAMAAHAVESAGGSIAKYIGDGVMALFGVPETAEDDADRAVRAGLALQWGFAAIRERVSRRHGAELGLRVGINTGEIVLADGDADLVGDAINTAARLEAACSPGQVLVGEETWRLTRSRVRYEVLGEVEVKGKDDPVATFLVADDEVSDDDAATPFVGRAEELARLRELFDDAIRHRALRLATLIGAPGVGKTRITREFAESLGDEAIVAELRCERSGTATFAPIADLLRTIAPVGGEVDADHVRAALLELVGELDDAERVADLLASFVGAAPVRSTEEAFLAVRRLAEAIGRRQPLLVVVDDIQWAEPLFLDLLEHLADWVNDSPVLLVGVARPELRELRPSLAEESRTLAAAIGLEGLDADSTAELAAQLVGVGALPSELVARLPDSTEGNPLFVRELMRMLVDDGVIEQGRAGWQMMIDVDAVEVPPTIQSLLASRLDRMPTDERRVVELASVVGTDFALGAVAAISSATASELRPILDRLRRRELVESTGLYWGDEPIFRFHHVLIRDAAYRRLLKRARSDLHLQVGEWTERKAADLPGEHEVGIAYHYEQAHEYRSQLDDVDAAITAVGRRAAELFGVAAERSLERDDLPAASTLAERALTRLAPGDPMVPSMLVVAAEAQMGLGDVASGRPFVERLAEAVGGDEALTPWAESFEAQLTMLTEPDRLRRAEEQAERSARRLAELGDESGVAKARLVRAFALARLGRVGDCEAELDQALAAARSAGDRRRVAAVLGAAPLAALWGPSPIPRAGGRCLDVIRLLRITTGSPAVEATSVRCQAVLEALRGRFDTARTMLRDARSTVEELGLRHALNETDLYAGIVELLAGEPAAAEGPLRAAYQGLGRLGIGADAGQAAAYLARSVLQQGRVEEAEALAAESAELAGENPQTAIAARAAQAEILAAQGRHTEAVSEAREAVARAEGTDVIVDHAAASAVLARVADLAGDTPTAERAARAAQELYEQKGATVSVPAPRAKAARGDDEVGGREAYGETVVPTSDRAPGSQADRPLGHEPLNEADRLARRFIEAFTAGAREHWLPMLSADQQTIDRRPLGFDTAGVDGVADAYPRDRATGALSSEVETVAVRGESLALVRWKAASTHDREWDGYHLTRWTDAGLNDLNVIFPPDQLDLALEELDRLYGGEPPRPSRSELPDEQTVADRIDRHEPWNDADRPAREGSALFFDPTSDGFEATVAPDHVSEDRRAVVGDRTEVAAATKRFDEPAAGPGSPGPWNEADRLTRLLHRSFLGMAQDGWYDLLDPEHVSDDRRPLVGHRTEGREETAHVWRETAAAAEGAPPTMSMETLAARGDRLVLQRIAVEGSFGDAGGALQILRWNERDRCDLLVRFDADDTAGATAELDRLWFASLDARRRAVSRLAVELGAAWVAPSTHPFDELLSDDFELVDGRTLGMGSLDRMGFEAALGGREIDGAGSAPVPSRVRFVSDDVLVFRANNLGRDPHSGVDWEEIACNVLVVEGDRIARLEMFDEDAWDDAVARARSITGRGMSTVRGLDNAATRWVEHVIVTNGLVDIETLAERFVREDRRSTVSAGESHRDEFVESLRVQHAMGIVWSAETVAVRGARHALSRVTGERSDSVIEFLMVTVVDHLGRALRGVQFDSNDIEGASARLDELWLATLDPAERATYRIVATRARAYHEGDERRWTDVTADGFTLTDRRPFGFGELDADAMLEIFRSRGHTRGHGTVIWPRVHHLRDGVLVRSHREDSVGPDGSQFVNEVEVLSVVRRGRVAHQEFFEVDDVAAAVARAEELSRREVRGGLVVRQELTEPDDVDAAVARAEQLAAERDTATRRSANGAAAFVERTAVPANAATRWVDGVVAAGGLAGVEMCADDFVREDRRSTVSAAPADRDEFVESLRVQHEMGAAWSSEAVAVRGERFGLHRLRSEYAGSESEFLTLVEVDEAGRARRIVHFDGDDLGAAAGALSRSWAATLPDEFLPVLRVAADYERVAYTPGLDGGSFLADDAVIVDHRSMGAGELDPAGYLRWHGQRADEGVVTGIAPEVVPIAPHVLLFSNVNTIAADDEASWEEFFYQLLVMGEGVVERLELFGGDQRGWALARAQEIAES